MADYRLAIVKHHDIPCLHVLIDGPELTETHIPIDDIQAALARYEAGGPDERPTIVKWTRLDGTSDTFVSGNEHKIEERLHGLLLCHLNGKITDLTIEH